MSQNQRSVVLPTAEAECVAVRESAKELIWLKRLRSDVTNLETPSLLVDNASNVKLAKNPKYHKRLKYVDALYHFVREKFTEGELEIKDVPGKMQLSDVMTKHLTFFCILLRLFSFSLLMFKIIL